MLFEVHQPIGHLQIGDVEDHPGVAKRRRIFAVRIDHDDMTFGRGLADAVQDQRGAGRFAGAGRAEQGEVLAKHGIDIEPGANVVGREDRTDLDEIAPVAGIDLAQIAGRRRIDQRAGDRIAGYAAVKAVEASGQALFIAFAEKIYRSEDAARGLGILFLVAHGGEQPAPADLDLDLAADLSCLGYRGIVAVGAFGQPLQIDRNHAARAGDFQHDADRLA